MSWRKLTSARPESALADRGETLARSELLALVIATIREQRLSQHHAAIIMGLDQPKISHLVRGHIEEFSTERLIRLLTALGRNVDIIVHPRVPRRRRGTLRVDLSS